jgi:hypothetical protein
MHALTNSQVTGLLKELTITGWGQGARLKSTHAKNLPKSVKIALRTGDKVAQSQEELLKWMKHLNPGLHTGYIG